MNLSDTSQKFRAFFLLKFTEELIRNSSEFGIICLREILEKKATKKAPEQISIKEEVRNKLRAKEKNLSSISEEYLPSLAPRKEVQKFRPLPAVPSVLQPKSRKVVMRAPALPPTVRDVRPVPSAGVNLDLGKLNPLIKDRNVREIEVIGENEVVNVNGPMGKKPTQIKLTKEEIDAILDTFSKAARIPKIEGIFKVVVGNLMITAMISKSISSRFVIKKLDSSSGNSQQRMPGSLAPPRPY